MAKARADASQHLVVQTVLDSLHRFTEHFFAATTLVADDLAPLDADERRDIAQLSQAFGGVIRDELAVCENLKVRVGMSCQDVKHLAVHERLAAKNAKERVAHPFSFVDHPVHRVQIDRLLLGSHIDPAALAAQIATVDDRDVQIRWKEFASLQPLFMLLHRPKTPDTHVPDEFPQQALIGFQKQTFGHPQVHQQFSVTDN